MSQKAQGNDRAPTIGMEAEGESAKERNTSGRETLLPVSLRHIQSPEAKARMRRALRLILKSAQGHEASDPTQIIDR